MAIGAQRDTLHNHGKIINETTEYDLGKITLEEVRAMLKQLKRRRAPGPDEIAMEAHEELLDVNLEKY